MTGVMATSLDFARSNEPAMKLTDGSVVTNGSEGSHVEHGADVEPATLNMATTLVSGVVVQRSDADNAVIWMPESLPSSCKQDSIV